MTVNPTHLRALPIVVLALAAVPLMAPAAANAALGGANAGTTTLLPDLRSASVINVSATGDTTIRVCFNKTIASVPNAGSFFVGNYRQRERAGDSASRPAAAQNCADVVFNSLDIDSTQRTYLRVAAGAVANLANGQPNLPDATGLAGSNSHNGTRGHAVAPNLEGVTVNITNHTVNFIFDKNVDTASTAQGAFSVTLQDGSTIFNTGGAGTVTISGNVVTVEFPPEAFGTPGNPPVRATVEPFAVTDKTDQGTDGGGPPARLRVIEGPNGAFNLSRMTVAMPGTGGISNVPDLIAATLAADGSYVDFLFDEPIVPGQNFNTFYPSGFAVELAGSDRILSTPVAAGDIFIVNDNTVRVKFPNNSDVSEYEVWAQVGAGVVQGSGSGQGGRDQVQRAGSVGPNPAAGVPMGGNAGAFATGFTTGPEALSVAFDNGTGIASVRLDQRFTTFDSTSVRLVDDAGAILPGTPISVSGAGGPAGQVVATAQFTPGEVSGARSLLLNTGAFTTNIGYPNVSQIVSPTAPAHYARKNGRIVRRTAKGLSRKQAARVRAIKRSFRIVR